MQKMKSIKNLNQKMINKLYDKYFVQIWCIILFILILILINI